MSEFNILDHVTALEAGASRDAYLDEHYRHGFISNEMRKSPDTIVIVEYSVAFPPVVARLKEWLADGVITDDEMSEIQLSEDDVSLKIPQLTSEQISEYRQQVRDHYRIRFNTFYNLYGDSVWDLFNRHSNVLSDIERSVKRQALILVRDFINRAITVQLGGVPTAFHIRGDGDEVYKV